MTVDAETGEEKEVTKMVPKKVSNDVEYTYTKLLDAIGADETLLETIEAMLAKKDTYSLVVGEDCITHPKSDNIAKLCGMVEKYTNFKVVVVPTQTNTLGVSQICDLDAIETGTTVGYNVKGDFTFSALGNGDIDMPVLSQQEGTFTNVNKKVVPTNAAIAYDGYTLCDIANEILDNKVENTIDYTTEIFKGVEFDALDNHFGNDMVEYRGYSIDQIDVEEQNVTVEFDTNSLEAAESEYIVYNGNPINQFNDFTAVSHQLKDDIVALYVSNGIKTKLEVESGDKVEVSANGTSLTLEIRVDTTLTNDISYVPTFDSSINTSELFNASRFNTANIKRV
jgi:NADH-quinone oxidoreductase subunit G